MEYYQLIAKEFGITGTSLILIIIGVFLLRNLLVARIKESIRSEYERDLKKYEDSLRMETEAQLNEQEKNTAY